MDIIRFQKQHIKELDISKEDKAAMLNYYNLYLKDDIISPSFAIRLQGVLKGMGGIRLISRGVGEAWVCFNPNFFAQHKKTIIVKIKDFVRFVVITFRLERIQAVIDANRDMDKRFIKFLGFRYEKKLERGFDIYSMDLKGV